MLVSDYVHPTPHGGRCRIRIYEVSGELPVVICTELPDNPGMSITNAGGRIAGEVLANHPDVFDPFSIASLPGVEYDRPFIWIEHYVDGARGTPEDPHTFDLVTFSSYEVEDLGSYLGEERKRIGEPSWQPLDRATVEALVGERLEAG